MFTLLIDGLDAEIWTLAYRHRDSHQRTTYLELVDLSQAEGDASRASFPFAAKPTAQGPLRDYTGKKPAVVLLVNGATPGSLSANNGHNQLPTTVVLEYVHCRFSDPISHGPGQYSRTG